MVLPSDKGENGSPPEEVVDVNEPEGQVIVGLTKSFGFDTCFDGSSSQVIATNNESYRKGPNLKENMSQTTVNFKVVSQTKYGKARVLANVYFSE